MELDLVQEVVVFSCKSVAFHEIPFIKQKKEPVCVARLSTMSANQRDGELDSITLTECHFRRLAR